MVRDPIAAFGVYGSASRVLAHREAKLFDDVVRAAYVHPELSGVQIAMQIDATAFRDVLEWIQGALQRDNSLFVVKSPERRAATRQLIDHVNRLLAKPNVTYFDLIETAVTYYEGDLLSSVAPSKQSIAEVFRRVEHLLDKMPFGVVIPVTRPVSVRAMNSRLFFGPRVVELVEGRTQFDGLTGNPRSAAQHDESHLYQVVTTAQSLLYSRLPSELQGGDPIAFWRFLRGNPEAFRLAIRLWVQSYSEVEAYFTQVFVPFRSQQNALNAALADVIWFELDHEVRVASGNYWSPRAQVNQFAIEARMPYARWPHEPSAFLKDTLRVTLVRRLGSPQFYGHLPTPFYLGRRSWFERQWGERLDQIMRQWVEFANTR